MASVTNSKKRQGIGYRRIVQLLVYLVIVPTVLLLALGIVTMFIGQAGFNLLLGILMVSFVAVVVTGVVLVLVFVRREANLSELQADFVSKVSHELRTPLTAIRLFAETLERSKGDPETHGRVHRRMLVARDREALASHRAPPRLGPHGGGAQALRPASRARVRASSKSAIDAFSPLRSDDKLVFEAEVDDGLPEVLVDRDAIVDALVNLLSNARKYGGTPPIISLRAYRDAKRRRRLRGDGQRRGHSARPSTGASSRSSTGSTIASRARAKGAASGSRS